MDRSMKVMFGMMTVAICMLAFTMMGNQSQQAYAGNYIDRGTEPTIVSFRVTPISRHSYNDALGYTAPTSWVLLTRMWSDGTVEMNLVGSETLPVGELVDQIIPGWITVKDSPPVNFACTGDTDTNGDVNITDLLALMSNWGECEGEPMTLSPDPDLM